MRETTMMADKSGRELFVGDTVRTEVSKDYRVIGMHGDWAEYEIAKAPGGYALRYLRSEKGPVLPYAYLCCMMLEFDAEKLPSVKDVVFAEKPVPHPGLTWIDDATSDADRRAAFMARASARQ